MILRRVIAHFRKQEWTAIALDFLIVVVGVFIGIQVANWNDERQTRADQRTFLEQLYAELAPNIEFWRTGNERLTAEDATEQFVIESIAKGALSDDDIVRFNAGLVSLVNSYGMDVSLLARRLESTDLMEEFRGTPYEKILVNLYRSWTIYSRQIEEIESRGNHARDIVFSRVFMAASPYRAPDEAALTPQYDFDALANDAEFVHAAAQLYHYNNRSRSLIFRGFRDIAETTKQLEAQLYPGGDAPAIEARTREAAQ